MRRETDYWAVWTASPPARSRYSPRSFRSSADARDIGTRHAACAGAEETSELAAELGVSARLIQQYRQEGILTPTMETPKGHARWDLDDVREQLKALRKKND